MVNGHVTEVASLKKGEWFRGQYDCFVSDEAILLQRK